MKKPLRGGILLILSFFSILTLVACGAGDQQKRYSRDFFELFDTVSRVIVYAESEEVFEDQADFIGERLTYYHELYNAFEAYEGVHNVYSLNQNAGGQPLEVDEALMDLLEFGKEVYYDTEGRVNIALGPVTFIWNDYRTRFQGREDSELPPMDLLQEAARHTDIESLVLDRERGTALLTDPEARLDVGAIAKGYAAQRVADEARAYGAQHLLMSLGGNVVALGGKFDEKGQEEPWQVGVQNPDLDSEEVLTPSLKLRDLSLVSSGDYERFYGHEGEIYAHIIDPDTLMPPRQFKDVTILAEDSGWADAYSTALFIMSLEEGRAFIEARGAEALWVLMDGSLEYSKAFRSYE